ncbi:MAG: hypothetical protein GX199_02150 [Firmicutes bacterium]|nr:hypothetical protein [Bacillota bacterium]
MQFLDVETRRELGFDAVWQRIKPVSPLGRAKQREAQAFLPEQASQLEGAWLLLEQAANCLRERPHAVQNLLYFLSQLRDISTIIERSNQGGVLDDVELYEVKKLLFLAEEIQGELDRLAWSFLLPDSLDLCPQCREALSVGQGRKTSFYLADAYDEQLAALRRRRRALEEQLAQFRENVDSKVREVVGRPLSFDDEITVSCAAGQAVQKLETMPELVKVEEARGTITFRLVDSPEAQQLRLELGAVQEKEDACKARLRARLSQIVGAHASRLLRILEMLGFLDFLLAKAQFCVEIQGVRPRLSTQLRLAIDQGRHLLVEEEVQRAGRRYQPITLGLHAGVTVITGPNMGGKTVGLKTIGLLTAMAQYGLLVPAADMELSPRRWIRAHLASRPVQGLSKFAEEMAFVREVLVCGDQEGLVLLDELAHGTNPTEGAAVAQAIVERLRSEPVISVITTHYPALARVEGVSHYRVKGLPKGSLQKAALPQFAKGLDGLQQLMDYTLEPASPHETGASDAALVAEALGLEPGIIARAKELQRSESHG